MNTPLLTANEFCEMARISRRYFDKLKAAGNGPAITRIGNKVFVRRVTAEAWIEARELPRAA